MQHRVRPFSLADSTKPVCRKILAIFPVDPHIRILSTSNVPPQQREGRAEEVRKIEPFAALPVELFDRIIEAVDDFPMSWEAACETRKLLMAERGRMTDAFEDAYGDVRTLRHHYEIMFPLTWNVEFLLFLRALSSLNMNNRSRECAEKGVIQEKTLPTEWVEDVES